MFKKLKDKISEEVGQSGINPMQQLSQVQYLPTHGSAYWSYWYSMTQFEEHAGFKMCSRFGFFTAALIILRMLKHVVFLNKPM